MRARILLLTILSARFTLAAWGGPATAPSIFPTHGSDAGGTRVTIHGPYAEWASGVVFGTEYVAATRVDASTLVAITPAHLPGTFPVRVLDFDFPVATGLFFTFDNDAEGTHERLLLPVFTAPVFGAFGSEFRTDLYAWLISGSRVDLYGLESDCHVDCVNHPGDPFPLRFWGATPDDMKRTGHPGRFIYIPKGQVGSVAMNLRAYDRSRSAENFGTEIPVVSERAFFGGDAVLTLSVPSDSQFRNTLRIYGAGEGYAALQVSIEGTGVRIEHSVVISGGTLFDPGYVELRDFPTDVGPLNITIRNSIPPGVVPGPAFWAFVTVTNNETQQITTITPQP